MRAEAEKKKAKADGTPKKKGRPKKTDVTLTPCTLLPEKRKGGPSRWVQSPFTEGKTDELEVPKKKLKTKIMLCICIIQVMMLCFCLKCFS